MKFCRSSRGVCPIDYGRSLQSLACEVASAAHDVRHGALAGAVSGATVLRCCLLLLRRAPYVTGACSARQRPQAALRYQTRAGKGWNLLWVYARHSDASFDDTPTEPAFSHNATPSLLAISPLAPLPSLAAQVHFTSTILWPLITFASLSQLSAGPCRSRGRRSCYRPRCSNHPGCGKPARGGRCS